MATSRTSTPAPACRLVASQATSAGPATGGPPHSRRVPARWLPLLLLLAGVLAAPARARAQGTSADTAAILLDAANRLSREGKAAAAAELLGFIRSHYASTPAAAEAARLIAAAAAGAPAPTGQGVALRAAPSGRTELVVWGTTYGIFLGLATPHAIQKDGSGAYGVGLLLGAPAGFLLSRAYADAAAVTEGEARAITFGGTWGTWQGYGWAKVAGLLDHTVGCPNIPGTPPGDCVVFDETSSSAALKAMIVGGLAGIVAGGAVGNNLRVTPGAATTVNLAAVWGTWYGAGTAAMVGADNGTTALAMALIGGDAALVGAALAVPRWHLTRERARLISIAGLAGVLAGLGIDLIVQVDDAKLGVGIPLTTGTIALAWGASATRRMPSETAAATPARPGGGTGGDALLRVEDGRVALGMPAFAPTLRPAGPRPGDVAPAVYVPLLRARF